MLGLPIKSNCRAENVIDYQNDASSARVVIITIWKSDSHSAGERAEHMCPITRRMNRNFIPIKRIAVELRLYMLSSAVSLCNL